MSYIEQKYINILGNRLQKFKRVNSETYNFRCPFCGDSKKDLNKARGYLYWMKSDNLWHYKCHNCGKTSSFNQLIKFVSESLYQDFRMEKFKGENATLELPSSDIAPIINTINLKGSFLSLNQLGEDNVIIKYIKSRNIPKEKWNELYYSDDLNKLGKIIPKYKDTKFKKDHRILIPIKNKNKEVIGIVCRKIGECHHSERYVILKVDDEPLVYGIESIDYNTTIRVVEGPIDSFFIKNSIAVSGADLQRVLTIIPKDKLVMIFDNQPRNREVVQKMKNLIDLGVKTVIWPENIEEKDINDMIIKNKDVDSIINNNTFHGLQAQLKWSSWKKC